jgi:transposase
MTYIELNSKERIMLEHITSNSLDARLVLRAYALIWLDEGESVDQIAQHLSVSRQTVYNWALRFQQRQDFDLLARLSDAPRSGRPPTAKGIIDSLIDEVISSDPRQLGYNSTVWTAPLLVYYLSAEYQIEVSSDSVSRAISRLRVKWKRPRHTLAMRTTTWRQAKGGLKRGFSTSSEQSL